MPTEHTVVVVSVKAEWDEETRMQHVNAQVGDGWRVQSVTPVSDDAGPGGEHEGLMRLQVILAREEEAGAAVYRGGAAVPRGEG